LVGVAHAAKSDIQRAGVENFNVNPADFQRVGRELSLR